MPATSTERAIVPGDKALLTGITQKPEMNGTPCTVVSWDAKAEKWIVELKGGAKARLCATNLALQPNKCPTANGDTSPPKVVTGPIATGLLLSSPARADVQKNRQQNKQKKKWLECHIPEDGAIMSPSVEVFRGPSMDGYPFHAEPAVLSVVSVAMPNCNPRCQDSPVDRPVGQADYEMLLRSKATAMFAASKVLDAEVVVLPSIGCGVFRNDPELLGRILGDVLRSDFRNVFKKVLVVDTERFGRSFLSAARGESPKAAIAQPHHPMKGAKKVITGSKPEFEGKTCIIEAWDEAAGQWLVVLGDDMIRLPDNHLMDPVTCSSDDQTSKEVKTSVL
jgi:hypothetical protein